MSSDATARTRLTMASIDVVRRAELNAGSAECRNLMEWLVVDMELLAGNLLKDLPPSSRSAEIVQSLSGTNSFGVVTRLQRMGAALARLDHDESRPLLRSFERHATSDIARQWAAYAWQHLETDREARLAKALVSAADRNMTVRECAWMAFRPVVIDDPLWALESLAPLVKHDDPNVRRFAVEVTRPRSVWGSHIKEFKKTPHLGAHLLEAVIDDPSRYVRLAVGNWLNDAAKSQPEWAVKQIERWQASGRRIAPDVRKRGLRSLAQKTLEGVRAC